MAEPYLQRRILWLSLILLVIPIGSVIVQQIVLDQASPVVQLPIANAVSRAEVNFCLNAPPTLNMDSCNMTAVQNSPYGCQLNITDVDGTANVTWVIFYSGRNIFNTTENGTINFTPTNDDVGSHLIQFTIEDSSGCSNRFASANMTLTVENVNDPPVLIRQLPDVTLTTNTTLFPYFLVDYFMDPDGDPMNFTSTIPDQVIVTIDATSLVSFFTPSCNEDNDLITFTATDPYNASATSNVVNILIICEIPPSDDTGDDDGGGGSGGGNSALCDSDWVCEEWFACLPASIQWQRCHDERGCAADRYLKRICDYAGPPPLCAEDWLCEDWGSCALNGTQERECTDLTDCTTTLLQPPLVQECTYLATCFDEVQNGDETAVDCGGSCGACPITESPAIATLVRWFLILLLLALLIAGGITGYYRTEVARLGATIGFLVRHRVKKDVLLTAVERRSLFERLVVLESRVRSDELTAIQRYDALAQITRSYLAEALALPIEASATEVRERVKALGLRAETTLVIEGLLGKLAVIEGEELEDDALFFTASIEEVRTAVCLTSEYTFAEIDRVLTEHPITEDMSFYDEIFARMTTILRAIQHGEVEQARAEYLQMIARYEALEVKDQEQIYPELRWLFDVTRLASEAVGGRIIDKSRFLGET